MRTNLYKRLQRRLITLFLCVTVLLSLVLLACIAYFSYTSNYEGAAGTLIEGSFLYYYYNHSWEFNIVLLGSSFALLLLIFIILFFRSMRVLLITMQGRKVARFPWFFRLFPEFQMAHKMVEDVIEKRNESRSIYEQEQGHKNELLMYLAHDLKTPLTSLIGYINHILDHKLSGDAQGSAIAIAYEKAHRLDDLIDEFSEILRYDDKVSQLDLTRIDIYALLQQQLNGFYPLMEKRNITLQKDIPQHIFIVGDFDKLLRVFDNLMRNAINYSTEASIIHVRVKPQLKYVELEYQNSSEEMDSETVNHLFDKFYRASTARTSTSGGAGLGLAIAREIIQLHHGSIEAKAAQSIITFTIRLPYEQEVLV